MLSKLRFPGTLKINLTSAKTFQIEYKVSYLEAKSDDVAEKLHRTVPFYPRKARFEILT